MVDVTHFRSIGIIGHSAHLYCKSISPLRPPCWFQCNSAGIRVLYKVLSCRRSNHAKVKNKSIVLIKVPIPITEFTEYILKNIKLQFEPCLQHGPSSVLVEYPRVKRRLTVKENRVCGLLPKHERWEYRVWRKVVAQPWCWSWSVFLPERRRRQRLLNCLWSAMLRVCE